MNPLIKIGAGVILRFYQKAVLKTFDNGKRYIVLRWSRRAGKSLFAWTLLIREAVSKPGTYWYCFDNYDTGYKNIWLAMTSKGVKFLDMIPKDMVARMNVSKLEIELTNGSIIKLIGINNADNLVGAGLNGVVFDEFAVLNPTSIEFITAMLGETGGWRVIISTPRGKNHFFEAYQFAENNPDFAYVDNKHCGMPEIAKYMAPGFLEQERLAIISKYGNDALYQQEYLTSWTSPNSGSVFGDLTNIMRNEGRVIPLVPDHEQACYAAYDLGNADQTSIVMFQVDENGFPVVLDHIEHRNVGVDWYVKEMEARGWDIHTHFLPHDGKHRKGGRNESYQQNLAQEGITNTVVLSKPGRVEDKLNHLRSLFKGMRVDNRLERLMTCLDNLEYEWNEKLSIWSDKPTHVGGYSDTVDSLCYMSQAIRKYRITATNVFSKVHVTEKAELNTPEAKKERFEKFIEESFNTLGGNTNNTGSVSTFI